MDPDLSPDLTEDELTELNEIYAATGQVYGGDPNHDHRWTWTPDDGNGHMGFVCACTAYRP